MKKYFFTLLSFVICILFISCDNEKEYMVIENDSQSKLEKVIKHFYGVRSVEGEMITKGVAQRDKLWSSGTVITVKFLNDPYNMADIVKAYASEWEDYANIQFEFVESGNANVRIGFDWNDCRWVTWSYTGTDCKYIRNQNEATLNFAFWDSANEADKKADVLRAFGQVLGLELEHRHLTFDAGWTTRIADYWEGEIEDIPWEELKEYVFDPIEERNLVQTDEYDESSIMIWPFDRRYATNTARDYNYELSEKDIEFIKKLYPKEIEEGLACMFKVRAAEEDESDNPVPIEFNFSVKDSTTFFVDFGDGSTEYIDSEFFYNGYSVYFKHYFDWGKQFTVKIYADPNIILDMTINGEPNDGLVEFVDISRCTQIKTLYIENIRTYDGSGVILDLAKNIKLEEVGIIYGTNLTNINLLNNECLKYLYLDGCDNLMNLDLSGCPQLEVINIYESAGFLNTQSLALNFANKLPVVSGSILYIDRYIPNFNTGWIRDICQSKGWELRY